MIDVTLSMKTITCCHAGCGIVFAVPAHWDTKRREDHSPWYCPNGHRQFYLGKSDAEKLRDELTRKQAQLDQAKADADYQRKQRDHAERCTAAARGQVTKIKNRVGNGVCPCCNRTFSNLMQHMRTEHPEWKAEEVDVK